MRVRLFAALREAAGAAELELEPGSLADIVEALSDRYGEPFRSRVQRCSALVDGQPHDPRSTVAVPAGAELALLPPFSGGAHC